MSAAPWECTWIAAHNWGQPEEATHILACICDKCEKLTLVNLCDECHQNWIAAHGARCGTCNGTLSWQTRNLAAGTKTTQINPSTLRNHQEPRP